MGRSLGVPGGDFLGIVFFFVFCFLNVFEYSGALILFVGRSLESNSVRREVSRGGVSRI